MSDNYDDLDRILASIENDSFDDFPEGDSGKDRKPVERVARGALSSAFSRVLPPNRRAEVVSSALPKGYSDSVDNYRDIEYNVKDLYSHTKEELVATEKALQRKANQLAHRIQPFLPKKLAERFDNWRAQADDGWSWSGEDREGQRNSEIESILNAAMANQERLVAQYTARDDTDPVAEAKEKAKVEIKEYTRDVRELKDSENIANIKNYIQQLQSNSMSVMGWRRKSLEVGIRQLFSLTDLVALIKGSNDRIIPALDAIVKNTALPDYAKESATEIALAMSKRRLIESVNPVEYARDFMQDFTSKAKRRISEIGSEVRSSMEFIGMSEMDDEPKSEEEIRQMYLEQGGSVIGDYLARKYAIPFRDKVFGKSRAMFEKNDRIKEMGEALKYYSGNYASIYNTELTDETEDSLLKRVVGIMSDIKGGYGGESLRISNRGEEWLNAPSTPDNRLYITQTEIIPAYLRSIDSAVWLLNGQEKDSVYDINNRMLVSASSFSARLRREVGQSNVKDYYNRGLDKLVSDFDKDGELSEEGRESLKNFFDDRVKKNLTFDIKALTSDDNMTEVMRDFDDTMIFEDILERMKEEKGVFGAMNEYSSKFRRLRGLAGNYQNEINRAILTHGEKALVDAGIFKLDKFNRLVVDERLMDPNVKFEELVEENKGDSAFKSFERPQSPQPVDNSDLIRELIEKINLSSPTIDTDSLEKTINGLKSTEKLINYTPKLDTIIEKIDGEESIISILREIRDKPTHVVVSDESSTDEEKETTTPKRKRDLRTIANRTREILSGGWKSATEGIKKAIGGVADVYNEDGKKILSGVKLKSGEYWTKVDGKLKQIFTIDDIKSAVYDKDGVEVLSEEQLEESGKLRFFKDGRWRKLSEAIGTRIKHVREGIGSKFLSGKEIVKSTVSLAKGYMFDLPDIYVAGESKPRLRAVLLKEGFYFSNDRVIKKLSDITGEVKDKKGRVVISEEEFNDPNFKLVDVDGNDVKNLMGRMISRVKKNLTNSKNLAMVGLRYSKEVLGKGRDRLKSVFTKKEETEEPEHKESLLSKLKGRYKRDDESSNAGKVIDKRDSYAVLVKIHNLLNRRMRGRPGEDIPEDQGTFNPDNVRRKASKVASDLKEKVKSSTIKDDIKNRFKGAKDKFSAKGKRSVFEQIQRNAKARELLRKRKAQRGDVEENLFDKVKTKSSKLYRDVSESDIVRRGKKRTSSVFRGLKQSLDAPEEKFRKSNIKVGVNDPHIALLKRIADSTEGNWVRGMAEDAQLYGAERSFQSQMMLNFSKKFRGGISRLYKKMAAPKQDKGDKKEGIFDRLKGDSTSKDKDNGILGTITAMLGGTLGALNTGLQSILGGIAAKFGLGASGSLMGGLAKGAGRLAWGGAKLTGKLLWGTAKFGAKAIGLSLATSATALKVAGAILGGVGSIITSPIALGVAAGAGVGYLAYKQLTKKTPSVLGRVRLAQYGTHSYNNWSDDDAAKMLYLESELMSYVRKGGSGYVVSGLGNEKMAELAEGFGIDLESEVELESFYSFVINRFIPFLLMWVQRLDENSVSGGVTNLENAKLDYETQKLIINNVRLQATHPIYRTAIDPRKADRGIFKSMTDWVGFTSDKLLSGEEVSDVIAKALKELDSLIARQKKTITKERNLELGKENFVRAYDKPTTLPKANEDVATKAYAAMYGNEPKQRQWHVGSLETPEFDNVKVNTTTPVRTGTPANIEKARAALYGLGGIGIDTITSIREIERLAGLYIDYKTGDIDLTFFEKAKSHVYSLGNLAQSRYGAAYTNAVSAWLRERFAPMYIAYMKSMSEIIGGGALLNPNIDAKVYSVLTSLVESSNGNGAMLIKQPSNIDMIGDFILLKLTDDIIRILETIKPKGPSKISESDVKKNINTRVAKIGKMEETNQPKEDPLAAVRERAAKIAESRMKEKSSINVRDIEMSDTGSGEYSQFANVSIRSRGELALLIGKIAESQGVDPDLLITTALVESSLNPNAKAPKGSAQGLFQFLDGTWKEQMEKHGNRLGIPAGTSPTDPVAATLLAAEYFRSNTKALGKSVGVVDAYMTHFLGAGGARKFMRAYERNPNGSAIEEFASESRNNPNVFYHSNGKPKTYEEIYRDFTNKFVARSSQVRSITGGAYGGNVFKDATSAVVARDIRREEAVINKAKRDSITTPINDNLVNIAPDGRENRKGSLKLNNDVTHDPISDHVSNAKANSPEMTERDMARYEEALTEIYKKPTREERIRESRKPVGMYENLINGFKENTKTTNDILDRQLSVQEKLLLVITHMDNKVGMLLKDKVSSREVRQNELNEIKEKSSMEIPIDLSNRTVNVSRNKSV